VNPRPPTATARAVIEALHLEPLPHEGGFFRQTWRSETSSAILFLLTPVDFSALHRLDREEIWHFHGGEPVEHVQLDPVSGQVRISQLGANVLAGEEPQVVVRAGVWQGARLVPRTAAGADFALMGCTVSPPWDDRGFTLGGREALMQTFPGHAELIRGLTR
jgi:predicted cupin superfamily sugar epimerase